MTSQDIQGHDGRGPSPPRRLDTERFLSIAQTRQYLAERGVIIARTTLLDQISSGRLRTINIGRRKFVPVSAIAELLDVSYSPDDRQATDRVVRDVSA